LSRQIGLNYRIRERSSSEIARGKGIADIFFKDWMAQKIVAIETQILSLVDMSATVHRLKVVFMDFFGNKINRELL